MALPTNTDWTFTYEEEETQAGEQIKADVPLQVLRNMDYSLRRSRLLASHIFSPKRGTSTGSWVNVFDGECVGPNILNSGVSPNIAATVYANCAQSASVNWEVRIYHATYGQLTLAVTGAGGTTLQWRGWMTGTFTPPGDDTIWGYTVDTRITSGAVGDIYVAGVALFY